MICLFKFESYKQQMPGLWTNRITSHDPLTGMVMQNIRGIKKGFWSMGSGLASPHSPTLQFSAMHLNEMQLSPINLFTPLPNIAFFLFGKMFVPSFLLCNNIFLLPWESPLSTSLPGVIQFGSGHLNSTSGMSWPAFHFPIAASIIYMAIVYKSKKESLFMFVPPVWI